MVYGGCIMKVDGSRIVISLLWKKWIIQFSEIETIVVHRNNHFLGIEYANKHESKYIKILVIGRKKLLSFIEPHLDCVEYILYKNRKDL